MHLYIFAKEYCQLHTEKKVAIMFLFSIVK